MSATPSLPVFANARKARETYTPEEKEPYPEYETSKAQQEWPIHAAVARYGLSHVRAYVPPIVVEDATPGGPRVSRLPGWPGPFIPDAIPTGSAVVSLARRREADMKEISHLPQDMADLEEEEAAGPSSTREKDEDMRAALDTEAPPSATEQRGADALDAATGQPRGGEGAVFDPYGKQATKPKPGSRKPKPKLVMRG